MRSDSARLPLSQMPPPRGAPVPKDGSAGLATQTTHAPNPLFYGFDVWADGLIQTATTTHQLAANKRRAARVFLACAGPVASLLDKLLIQRRAKFFAAHHHQIARITKLAEQMR